MLRTGWVVVRATVQVRPRSQAGFTGHAAPRPTSHRRMANYATHVPDIIAVQTQIILVQPSISHSCREWGRHDDA
jgi:hypothetical protein